MVISFILSQVNESSSEEPRSDTASTSGEDFSGESQVNESSSVEPTSDTASTSGEFFSGESQVNESSSVEPISDAASTSGEYFSGESQVNESSSVEPTSDTASTPGESSGEEYDYDESSTDADYGLGISGDEAKVVESLIEEALLAKIALENDSSLFELGHQYEDFVFECSFRGYDCR